MKFKPKLNKFTIGKIKCFYVYDYDEEVQKNLYQFKGCFDYELAGVFLDYFRPYFIMKYFNYIMVPAPSSKEADKERGFNHVVEMFKPLKLKMLPCIEKTQDIKQSSLKATDRAKVKDRLKINDVDLKGKRILIVDDVYTTGSTVKAMIELIKTKNPKSIKVLVMSKTKDFSDGV